MPETLKIQEEFENLIAQLERLRSINEMTDLNAQSSKKVIDFMSAFASSINEYKLKIDADFANKSETIENLISKLDELGRQIDSKTKELTTSVSNSFVEFKREAVNSGNSIILEIKGGLDSINRLHEIQKAENNLNFENLRIFILDFYKKENSIVKEHILQIQHSVNDNFTRIQNELIANFKSLNSSNNDLKLELIKNLNLSKTELNQKFNLLSKEIKVLKTILFILAAFSLVTISAITFILLK